MKFIQILLIFCFTTLTASEDFFILTIPKSGTHMMYKFLSMLTGKKDGCLSAAFPPLTTFYFYDDEPPHVISYKEFENQCLEWRDNNAFPAGHTNFSEPFAVFAEQHPEFKKIVLIRDLRDILVSQTFWESKMIELEIGPCSFEEKLLFVIKLGAQKKTKYTFLNIYKFTQRALWWMNDPEVIVTRYEDFVGVEGGGDRTIQENAIFSIAQELDITLSEEELDYLCDNIFGTKGSVNPYKTFRSGQIGEWKKYFNKKHKKLFKKIYGQFLIDLGYETDNNW